MTFRPGDLIGLPVVGDAPAHAIALRYALLAVAIACAAAALRGRRLWLAGLATLFVELTLLFWTASLARPYGLFADAATTRAAAEVATARLPGTDGALSGEPRPALAPVRLARLGLPSPLVIALPTLVPLLAVPMLAAAIVALWRREDAAEAAALWLVFSTTDAGALRGDGFLPGLWSHPGHALALAVVGAAALAADRAPWPRLRLPLAVAATLALTLLPRSGPAAPFADRLLAATVEQAPWLLLAAWAITRGSSGAALGLIGGGGALYLAGPLAADTWTAFAAYRIGLILAATHPLLQAVQWAAGALVPSRAWVRAAATPRTLGLALLLLATLPGSFVARWTPPALDATMAASQAPLSTNLMPALAWLRAHVPEGATCVASPDYAPLVVVMGGRRVLRAPDLWEPADDQRRRRAERLLLAGREEDLARRYQIGCVFFAASDVGWLGTDSAEALDGVAGLRRVYADAYVRVYTPAAGPGS